MDIMWHVPPTSPYSFAPTLDEINTSDKYHRDVFGGWWHTHTLNFFAHHFIESASLALLGLVSAGEYL
jgi:hypothetical protein